MRYFIFLFVLLVSCSSIKEARKAKKVKRAYEVIKENAPESIIDTTIKVITPKTVIKTPIKRSTRVNGMRVTIDTCYDSMVVYTANIDTSFYITNPYIKPLLQPNKKTVWQEVRTILWIVLGIFFIIFLIKNLHIRK